VRSPHHPPQPAVGGKHEMTVRLHKAPLAIDLLVEDRSGQLPGPGDRPAPQLFDHRPGISQALRVCRCQLLALGPQLDALGSAAFHLCSLRAAPPRLIKAVKAEGFGWGGVVAAAFGDVQVAGVFEGRDDGGADGGQVDGPAAGPAGGGVFTERRVPYMVMCLDGLITNGKFCCVRRVQLSLTWWHRPLRLRGSALQGDVVLAGEPDEPDLERVPSAQPDPRRRAPVGSGLSAAGPLGRAGRRAGSDADRGGGA
jgi:hypothetical protein